MKIMQVEEKMMQMKESLKTLKVNRDALITGLLEVTTGVRQQRIDEAMDGDEEA